MLVYTEETPTGTPSATPRRPVLSTRGKRRCSSQGCSRSTSLSPRSTRKVINTGKGSLVDDITRLVDTSRLDGRNMSRVIRVLYDHLDVVQFEDLLDQFRQ